MAKVKPFVIKLRPSRWRNGALTRARGLLSSLRQDLKRGSTRNDMVRAATFTTGMQVFSMAVAFLASLLYARALGPHGYGLYAYVVTWAAVLAIPTKMGVPQYLVREGAKSPEAIRALLSWADRRLLLSGALSTALMVSAFFIPAAAGARWLFVVAAPMPLLIALAATRSALLQAMGQAARSQWPRLVLMPFLSLSALLLLWLTRGRLVPMDLIVVMTLALLIPLGVNGYQLRRVATYRDFSGPAPSLRNAFPFMLISGLFLLNSRIDLLMLGSLRGAYETGIYAVSARIAEITTFALTAVNMVLAPQISRLYYANDNVKLQKLLDAAAQRLLVISIPIGLFLIVFAPQLLHYLYGEPYERGAIVIQILAAAQILIVTSGPIGTLMNMTGHENALAKNMAIAVVGNVALNLLFIPRFGAFGAAMATALSLVFSRILLRYQVRRLLNLRPPGLIT